LEVFSALPFAGELPLYVVRALVSALLALLSVTVKAVVPVNCRCPVPSALAAIPLPASAVFRSLSACVSVTPPALAGTVAVICLF
jgi:hypothetical protein